MSERGSFVTEYIYCKNCLEVAFDVLSGQDKFLWGRQVPSWVKDDYLPIIAGKIGGNHGGEEIMTFEIELIPELEKRICCPMRIAVIGEMSESHEIYVIKPQGD